MNIRTLSFTNAEASSTTNQAAGDELHAGSIPPRQNAEAIMLDFVDPT
jgi:hypothetical protein